MVKKLKARIEPYQAEIFDFFYYAAGENKAQELQKRFFSKVSRIVRHNRYEQYFRAWLFRLAVEVVAKQTFTSVKHFPDSLLWDERLALLLRERFELSKLEVASILQVTVGKLELRLLSAREKLAKFLNIEVPQINTPEVAHIDITIQKINWQRAFDEGSKVADAKYAKFLSAIRQYLHSLPVPTSASPAFDEINYDDASYIEQLRLRLRWEKLPLHYKIIVETLALGIVGTALVLVLPVFFSRYYQKDMSAQSTGKLQETVFRDLAEENTGTNASNPEMDSMFEDSFADEEFPGDGYNPGSAPIAPSRQKSAIYRLIVQSASPMDLVPHVRELFSQEQVKERSTSGRQMPLGVYFDGITTEANYRKIKAELQKIGKTIAYGNDVMGTRKGTELARVIVWIQQI